MVNRSPSSDNEVSNKKHIDDSVGEGTIVRINQTLQNYFKVSVSNGTYNLSNYDKIQITDTTIKNYPNTGANLLENWVIKRNVKNNSCKIQTFFISTKTNSPTGYSGAVSLLLLVIVLCILRQVLRIMVILFLSASNEEILNKFLI